MNTKKVDRLYGKESKLCRYCHSTKDLTVDHIIPKSKNGKNSRKNYQVLCYYCNQMKGAMDDNQVANLFKWFRYIIIKRDKPLKFE